MGSPGPVGPAGKDGVGPPPAPAFIEPGDWPKGNCYTASEKCTALGVADNLCGECVPVCDRCGAGAGLGRGGWLRRPDDGFAWAG